jgi:ribosome maturation factor RimP
MSGMMISTHFLEVQMNIEKIKEKLIPILKRSDLEIYSIRTKKEYGEKILEILIDVETMDINLLEKIHLEFAEQLTDDELDPDYFLELSSLGAERPLKTKEDLLKAVGKYIYLVSPQFKGSGTLKAFQNDILFLEINDKSKLKMIEIKFDDASKMRTSVKL